MSNTCDQRGKNNDRLRSYLIHEVTPELLYLISSDFLCLLGVIQLISTSWLRYFNLTGIIMDIDGGGNGSINQSIYHKGIGCMWQMRFWKKGKVESTQCNLIKILVHCICCISLHFSNKRQYKFYKSEISRCDFEWGRDNMIVGCDCFVTVRELKHKKSCVSPYTINPTVKCNINTIPKTSALI